MIVPRHVAFIMDGNGRWARQQGLPRSAGHKAGYERIPDVLETCRDFGIEVVSGFAWSTENWDRPRPEVDYVMQLLEENLSRFVEELHRRNIRFVHSGMRARLTATAREALDRALALTSQNDGGVFNLAFNYGGRAEIVHAARRLVARDVSTDEVSEGVVREQLWTAGLPDVDLVIRTGGDHRLSNFLLWQSAYALVYVSDVYWPAIGREDIGAGIRHYDQVLRRTD